MNKKILFIFILAVIIILPVVAFASFSDTESDTVTVETIIVAAEQTTLYIASGIVVILWVVTGILFLSGSGDPSKLVAARKALMAAVAGTVLVIVAASAISIIGSAFGLDSLLAPADTGF
jgi:hypothetical protein